MTAVSHIYVMEWAAIARDLVGGLLIAGALAGWVPASFWQSFFLTGHPALSVIWGPLVGPLVAVVSFVCSIGNVPLAIEAGIAWNYTTWLNIVFLALTVVLLIRFVRTGGPDMLAHISGAAENADPDQHRHH